jgi:ribosomal RNA methyltransferase Nop2
MSTIIYVWYIINLISRLFIFFLPKEEMNKTKKDNSKQNKAHVEKDDVNMEEEIEEDDFEENQPSEEEEERHEDDNKEDVEDNLEEDNTKNKGKLKPSKLIDTAHLNVDMSEVNLKIQHITEILGDFTNKKEEGKSRQDYLAELKNYLMIYYDYNEDIMDLLLYLFAPNECVEFLESNNTQRVLSIRTNTLKVKRRDLAKSLIQRGVNLDPLAEWTKVGLKIYDSQVPIGATPEYLSGQYMLQSGSSFLPVLALAPKENEKILDMSAAPGGKTTYISQLMKNTGVLVANDLKKERLKSLYFNIHRLGCRNTIITNYDGRQLPKAFNSFDRVLLDAPCSGLGVIAKDQSIKLNRTYKDIIQTTRIQKELILAAIDCVNHKSKTGGIIVYSTCSISVEENEWVVDYALKNRYVKLVDCEIQIGEEGFSNFRDKRFHPSLKLTRRIYPHLHGLDGFFVAKLKKYADGPKKGAGTSKKEDLMGGDLEEDYEEDEGEELMEDESEEEIPELVDESAQVKKLEQETPSIKKEKNTNKEKNAMLGKKSKRGGKK